MTYGGHAASSTTITEELRSAAIFVLRLVIPAPRYPPKSFPRPAAGDTVTSVAEKHPSLLCLGRMSPPGVTIGTKHALAHRQNCVFFTIALALLTITDPRR